MDTAALVDRMVDCFNRHDPEALATCYAPDARVHPAGWPQAVDTGTWLAAVPVIFTTFPDLRLHPPNLAADDRVALLEARTTGTNTGPFPSARPSGCCSAPKPRHCQRPGRATDITGPGARSASTLLMKPFTKRVQGPCSINFDRQRGLVSPSSVAASCPAWRAVKAKKIWEKPRNNAKNPTQNKIR